MTINRDDPWYPQCLAKHEPCAAHSIIGCQICCGVTIRLHIATEMMNGILAGLSDSYDLTEEQRYTIMNDAEDFADAMIDRANRDEGEPG